MHQQTNRREIRRSDIVGDESLSQVDDVLGPVTDSFVKLDGFMVGGTDLEVDLRAVETVQVFLGGLHHISSQAPVSGNRDERQGS